jgi:hypothetical protein
MKLRWTRSKTDCQPPTLCVALSLALALQYSTVVQYQDTTERQRQETDAVRIGVRKIPALPFVAVSYSITVCTSVHRQYFKIPRTIFYADVGCSLRIWRDTFPGTLSGSVRSTKSRYTQYCNQFHGFRSQEHILDGTYIV